MKRMLVAVVVAVVFVSAAMTGILFLIYVRSDSPPDLKHSVQMATHHQRGSESNRPNISVKPSSDPFLWDLIVQNQGKDLIRLPQMLRSLTPEQNQFIQSVKTYLLNHGAVSDIVRTDVPIYLPNVKEVLPELGAGNTIGYGQNTFILLRDDFFDVQDVNDLGQNRLRTFYHECAHAYLAMTYGNQFDKIASDSSEATQDQFKALVKADEDFAWYTENLLADYWQYRDQANLEPQRIERLREIYALKIYNHQESYPEGLIFWERHWGIPKF